MPTDLAATTEAKAERCWIGEALELAALARGWTSPNPMVGALVVKDGVVVGRGYHRLAGWPHAEAVALEEAGERARGADLYVTLEPCAHHGRTPPCTERIKQSGIRRVICCHIDPDPRVSGRGAAALRDAGLLVEIGPGEREARRLNEQYLHYKATGRPWVTLKWAQTIDGRVATKSGSSQWITGEEARRHAHRLRSWHDAVLVGIGTVLCDDPRLDVRAVEGHQPWHVVLDPFLQLPREARLVRPGQTLVICREDVREDRKSDWRDRGVDVEALPADGDKFEIAAVIDVLAARTFQSVFVEGGPSVLTSFLREGLADRVCVFIAPKILGSGRDAVGELGSLVIGEALRLLETEMVPMGEDWFLTGLAARRA